MINFTCAGCGANLQIGDEWAANWLLARFAQPRPESLAASDALPS